MYFRTLLCLVLVAVSWERTQALSIEKRGESKTKCDVTTKGCERSATATFKGKNGITGEVKFASQKDGSTRIFTDVINLSAANNPGPKGFKWHVHISAVGGGGDCAATGAHLNPTGVSDEFVCDPAHPEKCQVGDMAGKHGSFGAKHANKHDHSDKELRFDKKEFSPVGRSVVIHDKDKNRIACATVELNP